VPDSRHPALVAGSKTITPTLGFSLRLAMVFGEAISAKATCSSSRTRSDPFGETFGLPLWLAVATKAGWTVAMSCLASGGSTAVVHLLVQAF
jgi:hypothetical protein